MLLLLLACDPTALTVGEPDDTAPPPDDTSEARDTEEERTPDFSYWEGERAISGGDCSATLSEEGGALEADWEYYDWLEDSCSDCDIFYAINVGPPEVCGGINVSQEVLRGLDVDDPEQVGVYGFRNDGAYVIDDDGTLEGLTLSYDYETEVQDIDFTILGTVNFAQAN